jgi:hypothetical protein
MDSAIDGATQPRMGEGGLEQAMIARISHIPPGAEALKELRSAFPEIPLAQRVSVLLTMARRQNSLNALG